MSLSRYPIVIALDASEYSEIVLEHALDQAARHDAPDIHVITVVKNVDDDLDEIKNRLARSVIEGLDTFRGGRPDWRTRIHVRAGKPAEEIANLAGEVKARLLVIGRYGTHHWFRSVADRVLELVSCPTLVVGLTGRELESQDQCDACVKIREDSDGVSWFCAEHASPGRMRLTELVPGSTSSHGGVW